MRMNMGWCSVPGSGGCLESDVSPMISHTVRNKQHLRAKTTLYGICSWNALWISEQRRCRNKQHLSSGQEIHDTSPTQRKPEKIIQEI